MKLSTVLILVSLLNGTAVAQQRPNFSGQWVLARSSAARAATALTLELCVSDWICGNGAYRVQRYVPANRSAQPREYLSVERRFRNEGLETFEITVVSASVLSPFGTERSDLFAAFDGQTLIIPTGEQILRKEIWSLTPEGVLRIITTDRSTSGETVNTDSIYRRP
jgi:hypothetical protein